MRSALFGLRVAAERAGGEIIFQQRPEGRAEVGVSGDVVAGRRRHLHAALHRLHLLRCFQFMLNCREIEGNHD